MDVTQITYAALLAFAIWYGGPNWRLSAICVGNFIGTMALAASPIAVGVLDMLTIALLIHVGTWRGIALAAVFVFFIPFYVIGDHFEWQNPTIYAIVDTLGFVAIPGILASGSGGNRNRRNPNRPRHSRGGTLVASRGVMARHTGENT